MTPQEREQEILSLPFHDIDLNVCSVSKLSARGSELKRRIAENKSKNGFRDIKRQPSHYDSDFNATSTVGSKNDLFTSTATPAKAVKDISPPRMKSSLSLNFAADIDKNNNEYEYTGSSNSVPFQRSPFKNSPLPSSGINVISKTTTQAKDSVPAFSRASSAKGMSRAASNTSLFSQSSTGGMKKSSNNTSNSASSADLHALTDKQAKIREISLSEMPELILTRPPKQV